MALFKYLNYLTFNQDAAFDQILHPATLTPHSGIYRCEGCGISVVSTRGNHLPPQNHHQHTPNQGAIRWRLTVASTNV